MSARGTCKLKQWKPNAIVLSYLWENFRAGNCTNCIHSSLGPEAQCLQGVQAPRDSLIPSGSAGSLQVPMGPGESAEADDRVAVVGSH